MVKKGFKSCNKGYPCGGGCISVTYVCRKDFPEGVSVSIDGMRKAVIGNNESSIPSPKKDNIKSNTSPPKSDKEYSSLKEDLESKIESSKGIEKFRLQDRLKRLKNYEQSIDKERFLKELKEFESAQDKQKEVYFTGTKSEVKAATDRLADATRRLQRAYYGEPETIKTTDIKGFVEDANVMIQVKSSSLKDIVKDGRLKNTFEGKSPGSNSIGNNDSDYLAVRKRSEKSVLGVNTSAKGKDRPIYGYVERPERSLSQNGRMSQYGEVQLVLKNSVKDRSSLTVGDSMDNYAGRKSGEPLPKSHSMKSPKDIKLNKNEKFGQESSQWKHKGKEVPYVEAQIFGGVKLSDIGEVRVIKGSKSPEIDSLRNSGVKIVEIPPPMVMN